MACAGSHEHVQKLEQDISVTVDLQTAHQSARRPFQSVRCAPVSLALDTIRFEGVF